eukprot:NODE_57_length_28844_cov_0.352687.p11 type:complete len:292 gc:universal NODE_57_length_28844_cov_0.352687:20137-19262(-)
MKSIYFYILLALFMLYPLLQTLIELIRILYTLVFSKVYTDEPQQYQLPKIIHQIAYYDEESKIPEGWKSCKEFWEESNPDWKIKRWNEKMGDQLILDEYTWLWDTYNSYSNVVQKVDLLRLVALHKYGGIYADLDICAKKSFEELRQYEFGVPQTDPHGYSNFMLLSRPGHPILMHFLAHFEYYNRFWFLPYLKVMCSTGPFLLTYLLHTYPAQEQIRRLPDHWNSREYISFRQGSTWHEWDSVILITFYENLYISIFLIIILVFGLFWYCCNPKKSTVIPLYNPIKHHEH